jgi:hypothetical protein
MVAASRKLLIRSTIVGVVHLPHSDKATWYLFARKSFDIVHLGAIADGRSPDLFMEEGAEGAQAFKSDLKTNVGHRQFARGKQFLGAAYPSFGQVLMGSPFEDHSKEAQKVKTRKTGFARNHVQIQRLVVMGVYKCPGAAQSLIDVLMNTPARTEFLWTRIHILPLGRPKPHYK